MIQLKQLKSEPLGPTENGKGLLAEPIEILSQASTWRADSSLYALPRGGFWIGGGRFLKDSINIPHKHDDDDDYYYYYHHHYYYSYHSYDVVGFVDLWWWIKKMTLDITLSLVILP